MKHLIIALAVLLSFPVFAQNDKAAIKAKASAVRNFTKDIGYLASDELKGRETGTEGERLAAEYISKRFKQCGLQPKGTEEWYQEFTFTPKPSHPHGDTDPTEGDQEQELAPITGKNVIGWLDNGADLTVVIGAHYDHLGMGGEGSRHTGDKAVHNGADDNASGVAAMIELASWLRTSGKCKNNNYLFIAFSGEEKGLWGSNHFVKNPTIELSKVHYMLNMDMVGRMKDDKTLAINGTGTSPIWEGLLSALPGNGMKFVKSESGVGPSDHTSFYLNDIPVLHFFTGQHEDYHKPSDDIEKINYDGMYMVTEFMKSIIVALDDDPKLKFTKTKDENSSKAPKFSVTLGVMPDYLFSGPGMRIDGVVDDRPAQRAGIEKGDIVLKMGEVDVNDMRSYMTALSTFKKGDVVPVRIKRGEEEIEKMVEF